MLPCSACPWPHTPRSLPAPRTWTPTLSRWTGYPNANLAGLFLAQERGYYADEGLAPDFCTPSDPTTVLQTVGAGRDAFGMSYQTDLLLARAAGVPVTSILALTQRPLQGIMVMQESGISRPAALAGKTVGYPGIPSQEAFLATMMAHDGASMNDVEVDNIGFDLVPGLVSGRVVASLGAFWAHEPILAAQEGFATAMLRVDDWGVPPYYELILIANEHDLATRQERIEGFLRATRRSYEDAIADPAAALTARGAASPEIDMAVETEGIRPLIPAWTDAVGQFGTQTAQQSGDAAAWMVENGPIPEDLDLVVAWAGDLAPQATPTA